MASNYDGLTRNVWPGTWSTGTNSPIVLDTEGRVDRFMRKYGMSSSDSDGDATKKEISSKDEPTKENSGEKA